MAASGHDERLRLDYDRTTDLLRDLTDVRFKLLAFVPTISGAAVGLVGRRPSGAELISVGVLGLVATLGIVLYELRNSAIHDYALDRARHLEAKLGFDSAFHAGRSGGLFSERPGRGIAARDRGLALVYGAAIGGWAYLLAWGALRALGVQHAQSRGLAVGALAALVVLVGFLRLDARPTPASGGGAGSRGREPVASAP